jgi:hypothetical protein
MVSSDRTTLAKNLSQYLNQTIRSRHWSSYQLVP